MKGMRTRKERKEAISPYIETMKDKVRQEKNPRTKNAYLVNIAMA